MQCAVHPHIPQSSCTGTGLKHVSCALQNVALSGRLHSLAARISLTFTRDGSGCMKHACIGHACMYRTCMHGTCPQCAVHPVHAEEMDRVVHTCLSLHAAIWAALVWLLAIQHADDKLGPCLASPLCSRQLLPVSPKQEDLLAVCTES